MERDKELGLFMHSSDAHTSDTVPCRSAFLLSMLCCGQEKVPLEALVEPAENLLSNSETQLV